MTDTFIKLPLFLVSMASFKLTINDPKTGKSHKRDITGKEAEVLFGKDIGETITGDAFGFAGYEFVITGASDNAGFPLRHGLKGFGRKRILTYKGVGFPGRDRHGQSQQGLRMKKTMCGEKIYPKVSQINMKIAKIGPQDLFAAQEQPKEAKEQAASA